MYVPDLKSSKLCSIISRAQESIYFFFIPVWLIYDIIKTSGIQQSDPSFLQIILHLKLL